MRVAFLICSVLVAAHFGSALSKKRATEGQTGSGPSPRGRGRKAEKGISDGHRLITRALWRIFDALMEKKNHEELYGRMKFVENSLSSITALDTQLESKVDLIMSSLDSYKVELSNLKREVEKIKSIEGKIRILEDQYLIREQPRDDSSVHSSSSFAQAKDLFGGSPVAQMPLLGIDRIEYDYGSCPPPFENFVGDCYYVYLQKKLGWKDARRECSTIGGDLAAPSNMNNFRDYLFNLPRENRPEYIWMGASKQENGQWTWSTGSQTGKLLDMSQKLWNDDLPEGTGDCLGLYERAGYRAYDYKCEEQDFFVCQYYS